MHIYVYIEREGERENERVSFVPYCYVFIKVNEQTK